MQVSISSTFHKRAHAAFWRPAVNFINVKCSKSAFWQLFLLTCNCQKDVHTKNAHVKCWWNWHLVFFEAFLYLHFVFVIFWQMETVTKSCLKNLVKLSTGINFINILQTAFLYPSVQKGIILKIRTMHLISNTSLCLSLSQSVTSVLLNMDNMYIIYIYVFVCVCYCDAKRSFAWFHSYIRNIDQLLSRLRSIWYSTNFQ